MGIITKDTAYRIWTAHHQIEVADKLLADIWKTLEEGGDPTPADPHNRHSKGFSLGVPHGMGERILGVNPILATKVVEAHRDNQWVELGAACAIARQELTTDGPEFDEVEAIQPAAPVQPPFSPDDEIVF